VCSKKIVKRHQIQTLFKYFFLYFEEDQILSGEYESLFSLNLDITLGDGTYFENALSYDWLKMIDNLLISSNSESLKVEEGNLILEKNSYDEVNLFYEQHFF
jgi:hypothetical protein